MCPLSRYSHFGRFQLKFRHSYRDDYVVQQLNTGILRRGRTTDGYLTSQLLLSNVHAIKYSLLSP